MRFVDRQPVESSVSVCVIVVDSQYDHRIVGTEMPRTKAMLAMMRHLNRT